MSGEIVTEKKNKSVSLITPRIHLRTPTHLCLGKDFHWRKVVLIIGRNFYWPYAHFWISFTWERIILPLTLSCVMALIFGAEGKSNEKVTAMLLPPSEILIFGSLLSVPEASLSLPKWSLSNMVGSAGVKRCHQGRLFPSPSRKWACVNSVIF